MAAVVRSEGIILATLLLATIAKFDPECRKWAREKDDLEILQKLDRDDCESAKFVALDALRNIEFEREHQNITIAHCFARPHLSAGSMRACNHARSVSFLRVSDATGRHFEALKKERKACDLAVRNKKLFEHQKMKPPYC